MAAKAAAAPVAELTGPLAGLKEKFGEAVKPGDFEGVVINHDRLVEVATYIRDELGYDYLTSVTGVDYLAQNEMEVVYHVLNTRAGGAPLVFKARTPRENAVVPSLITVWPGADFQEREAWDLLGIKFEGHPYLKRILMWEGFSGHPLRKDWKEAYYEQDVKPFDSRWPGGHHRRAEDRVPYADNVNFPADFDPTVYTAQADAAVYERFKNYEVDERGQFVPKEAVKDENGNGKFQEYLETDELVVNLGPQHPSTHGVFRMVVALDGEKIMHLEPVMGYLHRNHEKIGERNTYIQNMPFTDRLDYLSSMSNNFGYALAVEKLMKVTPPERAEYIRVIMAELTRICNHVWAIGFLLNDLGAFFTPALYAIEERELILDLFEAVSGSRMMCNYFRFGGVARDLPVGWLETCRELVFNRLPKKVDELDYFLSENEIIRARCEGSGVLTGDDAVKYSTAGPVLRASGVAYDVRRAEPYSIYERFEFDVAVRNHGDVYDRYLIRLDEVRQSLRILQQALNQIPEKGEIQAGKKQYSARVPAGQAYGRVEGPKGELGFYVVSDGTANPYRYHIRAPSFINLTALGPMSVGQKIADAVIILGSIDIVLGETDR
ncbi:NADH-quinone oxidoreductase subunit C/D [Thermoflexales bacterium]|nr:NADH-quinone oxidoreductase subunit C/D [Thermoflexales bacterium]